MLSRPDFTQKQIIFITIDRETEKCFKFSNDNIIVYTDGKITQKSSLHKIFAIYIIGQFTITSNLLEKCLKFGISLYLLKYNLEIYGSFESYASANFLLRYQQYHLSDLQELQIAKLLIKQKTHNQLKIIKPLIEPSTYRKLKTKTQKNILDSIDSNSLLGIEGTLAKLYFQALFHEHEWRGRQPRAKNDINNLLLDIGYTYLFNFTDALLKLYGFDTYKGVYHKLFFQRKSLACDIMEPFRPIIDYTIKKSYNLGQIKPEDFEFTNGSYLLPWKHNKHYSQLFMTEIMRYKLDLYDYTKTYYRYIMNPTDNHFPKFIIKSR
jgi:CRISP-associated protein Cas1